MPSKLSTSKQNRRWEKSRSNRVIDGVCAGLAEYLNADPTLVRIAWLAAAFLKGIGVVAYVAAMILVPSSDEEAKEPGPKQKGSAPLIAGMLLIALAFLLIFRRLHWRYDWFPVHSFPFFWYGFWTDFWPMLLIAAGIAYLIYVLRNPDKSQEKTERTGAGGKFKKWARSRTDKKISGVCGGLAERIGLDANVFRVAVVVVALSTHALLWMIAYLILAIALPVEGEP